jgi:hypothetical protein
MAGFAVRNAGINTRRKNKSGSGGIRIIRSSIIE